MCMLACHVEIGSPTYLFCRPKKDSRPTAEVCGMQHLALYTNALLGPQWHDWPKSILATQGVLLMFCGRCSVPMSRSLSQRLAALW